MMAVHLAPIFLALLVALGSVHLLMKRVGEPSSAGRFAFIDGLRGYLAFFVFIHHASVWRVFLTTGTWKAPDGNLYNQLGHTSVTFFFMITGFLFFGKILEGRKKKIDWLRLYVSRVMRLTPLYFLAVGLVCVVVMIVSRGQFKETPLALFKELVCWSSFTVLGSPDINAVPSTIKIMAGVTWSLPYEWFFYFCLPLAALAVRARVPLVYLGLGALAVYWLRFRCPAPFLALMFAGGMVAVLLTRSETLCRWARTGWGSGLALGIIGIQAFLFPGVEGGISLLMLGVAFAIFACGNDLWGFLSWPVSRMLGEISYSVYLLHGIVLFVLFRLVLGAERAASLPMAGYWAIVLGVVPLLIGFCYLTFRFVEKPGMNATMPLTDALRSRLKGWSIHF